MIRRIFVLIVVVSVAACGAGGDDERDVDSVVEPPTPMTTELPSSPLEGEKLFVEDPPPDETAEPGSESIGVSERISIIITDVDGNVIETRKP